MTKNEGCTGTFYIFDVITILMRKDAKMHQEFLEASLPILQSLHAGARYPISCSDQICQKTQVKREIC